MDKKEEERITKTKTRKWNPIIYNPLKEHIEKLMEAQQIYKYI